MQDTIVVAGGGHAAAQVVDSLRRDGYAGRLVMACGEPVIPYPRPPLSKTFLAGELPAERLGAHRGQRIHVGEEDEGRPIRPALEVAGREVECVLDRGAAGDRPFGRRGDDRAVGEGIAERHPQLDRVGTRVFADCDRLLGFFCAAAVVDRDAIAALCECNCGRRPDAGRTAGDDGNGRFRSGPTGRHGSLPLWSDNFI
jgi:hypothetical protein